MSGSCFLRSAWLFQSTHPLRDATRKKIDASKVTEISIHAPLTGCDKGGAEVKRTAEENFNPRTPYGMRPLYLHCTLFQFLFQSTHPLRDATVQYLIYWVVYIFQSTHPLRDATQCQVLLFENYLISIHAPLTGCDRKA